MKWLALVLLVSAVAVGTFAAGYLWPREDGDDSGACTGEEARLLCSSERAVERFEREHDAVCVRVYEGGLGGRGYYRCESR